MGGFFKSIRGLLAGGGPGRAAAPGGAPLALDAEGVRHELTYWRELLASGERPEYVSEKLPEYLTWLGGAPSGLRILDVGSGPFPFLAPVAADNLVIGADPLAREYAGLLDEHGASSPVPVVAVAGEDLPDVFAPGAFDLVECNNALDHTTDPARVFGNLIALTRPGGGVHVAFMDNERTHQGATGFHQWDLTWREDTRTIEARGGEGAVQRIALTGDPGFEFIQCDIGHDDGRVWHNVYLRRTDDATE